VASNHVKVRVMESSPSGAPGPRKWDCQEYLGARKLKGGTLDLWHPVKDRQCLFEWLAQQDSHAPGCSCAATATPPSHDGEGASNEAGQLRSLRRRSIAWAERWKAKEEQSRPFVAAMRAREAQARNNASL
jgi:hypothetical protein